MNFGNLDQGMMARMQQAIMSNPRLASLAQKPEFQRKLQQYMSNPMELMNSRDPEIIEFMNEVAKAQSGGGGFGDMMGNQNMYQSSSQSQSQSQSHIPGEVLEIMGDSITNFNNTISSSTNMGKVIVVDWYATWCGPCQQIKGDYIRLAKFYKDNALFLKVDVDRNPNLSRSYEIRAMPTFTFFKNGNRVDEMSGANIRQLERLLTKHVDSLESNENTIQKPSPYESIPIISNNVPVYAKAAFDKMNEKLKEFQKEHDDKVSENAELLQEIITILQDKSTYHQTTISNKHFELVNTYIKKWPEKTLYVVLDLIRVLVLHPSANSLYAKNKTEISNILKIGIKYPQNDTILCLVCRIFINLFSRQSTRQVIKDDFTLVEMLVKPCMKSEAVNTRSAFIQILSCYAYYWHIEKNKETLNAIKMSNLLIDCLSKEKDSSVAIKAVVTLGTLVFRSKHIAQVLTLFDLEILLVQIKKERFESQSHSDIQRCINELIRAYNDPSL